MKKYTCLALCVLLALTAFWGCGASEAPAPAPAPAEEPAVEDGGEVDELPVSLWNKSEYGFVEIAMKLSESEDWPDDWWAEIELNVDEAYEIWLGSEEDVIELYDIELIDTDGDIWSLLEVPLGQGSELLVFDEESAWTGAMNGENKDIEVIFTNTENDEDYVEGPVGVWEVRAGMGGEGEPDGEMELLEDGTLITRDNSGGEVLSTYSLEEDTLILHYDEFDLTFVLEGDVIYTQSGSEYAFRK